MKVLIAFLAFSATLYSFTLINNNEKNPNDSTFNPEYVVSTETLNDSENLKISEAIGNIAVTDAKVFTMKDGETFLEYSTILEGKVSTFMVVGLNGVLVPPCHCGPGSDGIYNAWWEGLTPYRYKRPYCLPCAVEVKDEDN